MRLVNILFCLAICFNANCQIDSLALKYDYYHLQNGLEVILQQDNDVEEVSVEFWLRDGTSLDRPEQYGLQHFFEHVMPFSEMDSIKKSNFFDSYLKGSNAQVKKDFSRFYLQVVPEGIELALERAAGRLFAGASSITEDRVEHQRKRVLAEIERNAKNPHWSAEGSLAINEGTFGKGHPYAANGYGKVEHNKTFTLNDFRQRYDEVVYAENIVLFVVGNFDKANTKKLINRYFNQINSKKQSKNTSAPVKQSSISVSMKAPHPQDSLNTKVFSWAISERDLKDEAVLKLAAAHLNHTFKTKNYFPSPIAYVGVNIDMYRTAGQFQIRIRFSNNEDSGQIEKIVLNTVKELTKRNMTDSDLMKAKESEISDVKQMQEKLGFQWSRTELLGKSLLVYNNPSAYFERLQIQQQLTSNQITETVKKWLNKKPFMILFTSNKE